MAFLSAEAGRSQARVAPALFTATIFLSASLLFFVQPLFAKIVLPVIGGSPAVWTTAMLFFQSVLLLGYLYAHLSTRMLPVPVQVGLHMALWAAALLFLPPALPDGWTLAPEGSIAFQTLGLFALGVGVPFALLSSNAPLIQSWYARSDGPSAGDPYFLYAASNLGSLLALLAFPLVAEMYFGAGQISRGFSTGFVVLGAGLLGCGALVFARRAPTGTDGAMVEDFASVTPARIGLWLFAAFLPSSLMLAVTSKIGTDIGAVPLVWVIPLALYLLSFVVTFSAHAPARGPWLARGAQLSIVLGLVLFAGMGDAHLGAVEALALVFGFFVVACWAHRLLYEARPDAGNLTLFYVTMSVGGAMGGLFNSLLAPAIFTDLHEGTITLVLALALALHPVVRFTRGAVLRGLGLGLVVGLAVASAVIALSAGPVVLGVAIWAAILGLFAVERQRLGAFAVAAGLTAILPLWLAGADDRLFADRSFFGTHQVVDRDGARLYANGTTVHGAQVLSELGAARPKPTSYYHPEGPMGQILRSVAGARAKAVGVVGLGVGALACHAREGQDWHFYEIDALVDRVARDSTLFTYLSACTPSAPTHLGDARVVLEEQKGLSFGVLVIDAYSSDSVPVHLTTREAMELYLSRLDEDGVLVFHISSRYYDIGTPLARSAEALGIKAWRQFQSETVSDDPGFRPSDVVMMARDEAHVADLLATGDWAPLASDGGPVWTDDRANPLSILVPGALR